MAKYILICIDSVDPNGLVVAAATVARRRIQAGLWPIHSRTSHRRSIAPGDRVLVYQGGRRARAQEFIATAEVVANEPANEVRSGNAAALEGDQLAAAWLRLGAIQELAPPVLIRSLLDHLSFIPKNRTRWGAALLGGVRRIGDDDWNLVVTSPRPFK